MTMTTTSSFQKREGVSDHSAHLFFKFLFPEGEGREVLEVDVSPTRGSSTVLPCGTSGSPLASPQTPSLLQESEEAYGHDHPFPFPEDEGALLRGRLCRDMAAPYPFLEEGGCLWP